MVAATAETATPLAVRQFHRNQRNIVFFDGKDVDTFHTRERFHIYALQVSQHDCIFSSSSFFRIQFDAGFSCLPFSVWGYSPSFCPACLLLSIRRVAHFSFCWFTFFFFFHCVEVSFNPFPRKIYRIRQGKWTVYDTIGAQRNFSMYDACEISCVHRPSATSGLGGCVYMARLNVGRSAKGDETMRTMSSFCFTSDRIFCSFLSFLFIFRNFFVVFFLYFPLLFSVSNAVRSVWVGLKASLRADGENNSKRSSRDTNGMDGKRDGSVKLGQKMVAMQACRQAGDRDVKWRQYDDIKHIAHICPFRLA